MEYLYAIDPYSKTPTLQVNKHIGYDEEDGQGIDGIQFAREFFELDCLKPEMIISMYNTMGGDVKQGLDMFNAIAASKSKTKSIICGFAYSTGGWIPLAADVVEAYDYSSWMCHLPYNPDDENQKSVFLDTVLHMIATIISKKSGRNGKAKKSYQEIVDMMKTKTYYTAQELYDNGLIDKIINSSGEVRVYNKEEDAKKQYKEFQKVFNKYIDNKKTTTMAFPKVINRLNDFKAINLSTLTEDAGEDVIVSHLSRIENEFNAVNKEKETLTAKLKVANESQEELQKKLLEAQNAQNKAELDAKNEAEAMCKMKNDMDAMEAENKALKDKEAEIMNKSKEQEEANKKERAVNLVKPYIGTKIKAEDADTIAIWEKQAVENYDATKVLLESLPTNFKAPVLVNTGTVLEDDKSRLGRFMKENQAKNKEREEQRKLALEEFKAR